MLTHGQCFNKEKFMLKTIKRYFPMCILPALIFAGDSYAGKWPIEIFEVMDNKNIVVFLHDEDIKNSPEWEPRDNAPPLTINEALHQLKTWQKRLGETNNQTVNEIELKRIRGHEKEHRWYYLIQLSSNTKGDSDYVAVLLSGKVVPAISEPSAIK